MEWTSTNLNRSYPFTTAAPEPIVDARFWIINNPTTVEVWLHAKTETEAGLTYEFKNSAGQTLAFEFPPGACSVWSYSPEWFGVCVLGV